MKTVILAEKPSQAQAYAESFEKNKRESGYYQISGQVFDNATITYGVGHLVELYSPEDYNENWKNWQQDTLPIFPEQYKFKVSKDKKKQYNVVKKQLDEADEIIIATDSDREGEAIARLIIRLSGNHHKPIKRLWINSLEPDEIQKGFHNLKDGNEFYSSFIEAETRQISDWLVGINLTRLYTLNMQQAGMKGVFSVGRVQTPTLYMIYKRNQEIDNFIVKPFYELYGNFEHEKGTYKGKYSKRFDTKEELQEFININKLNDEASSKITKLTKENKQTYAPKLFSLSDLQSEANKKFNMSASETLKTAQNLYEKKYTSYPRSDSNFIGTPEFNYLKNNLDNYLDLANLTIEEPQLEEQKRYVNGAKVQEHYAIIPTRTLPDISKLNDKERKIYNLILLRTLSIFEKPYLYKQTTIITTTNDIDFKTTGKIELDKGWKKIYKSNEKSSVNEEKALPNVQEDDVVKANFNSKKGETQPPKHYTEGTLLTAMKHAGNQYDNDTKEILKETEGIGTEATRANIIENLKSKEYIMIEGKKLLVSEKGVALCEIIEKDPISNAEMTAKWETYLKQIRKEKGTQEAFLGSIKRFIEHTIETIPDHFKNNVKIQEHVESIAEENTIGTCPNCNGYIIDKGKFYGCSNYKEKDCHFSLPKKWSKKKLSKKVLDELITKGETSKIKGFTSKKGNKFNAGLKLDNGKISFVFE